jgi:DNA-binding transcriptional MerR regulator
MTKNPEALKTISEVADELDLPQHVLRFWETRFSQIKPMKRGGGRRYYRPDDIDLLKGIKALLYDEGYTIRGVQRLLKEQGNRIAIEIGRGGALSEAIMPDDSPDEIDQESNEAISVSDLGVSKRKLSSGFLGRLKGARDDEETIPLSSSNGDDIKVLEATLQDLLECKRLLDQTRQG